MKMSFFERSSHLRTKVSDFELADTQHLFYHSRRGTCGTQDRRDAEDVIVFLLERW